jgi:hypothetical protein
MLQMFIRSLKAEYIKTKASGLKWLCLGAAAFIPVIQFLFYALVSDNVYINKPQNPWMEFINGSISAFAPFFYPLLCVLIVLRLAQFEHKADAWKLLETQPVPKAALYFSKWIMCVLVALACLFLLLLISVFFVFLLSFIKGDTEYKTSGIEWGKVLWFIIKIWIAGFGLMALQYLLSIAISNFIAPFVIGLIATIAGTILGQFQVMPWWPYTAPQNTASYYAQSPGGLLPHELLSILFMLLFLFLGFRLFSYKKIKYATIKPASRLVGIIACLVVFAFAFWFVNRPKQPDRGINTVIAGEIESKEKISSLYLMNAATKDTIEVIPVQQNRFAARLNNDIPASFYYLRIGSEMKQVFLGKGDSIYIDAEINEKNKKTTITGTRVAENSYSNSNSLENNFWYLENMAYQYQPKQYANNILDEWRKGEKEIDQYHTVSNIKPADDFCSCRRNSCG